MSIDSNNNENLDPSFELSNCNNRTRLDSGYLTIGSPCFTSPSRLSPLNIHLEQVDSPLSEYDPQSPTLSIVIRKKYPFNINYEQYRTTRKHFDILTQLNQRNASHVIEQIFNSLSRQDLFHCSLVCRKWYFLLKTYSRSAHVKRNLFVDSSSKRSTSIKKPLSEKQQTITNLLDIQSENPVIEKNENVHLTASTMTFRYGYLKYLHGPTITKRCPICAYVSIIDVNDQHGICTNPLCRNSFCQCCSGPYHPFSPCKTSIGPIRSPWRQRPSYSPIFSSKTRTNLRRLLI